LKLPGFDSNSSNSSASSSISSSDFGQLAKKSEWGLPDLQWCSFQKVTQGRPLLLL
jgi:hypothetical protein